MRAWLADFGGGIESLRQVELDEPVPGVGEVLIQVEIATLNRRDQNVLDGYYPLPVKPTLVPGCDAVGTILATGADCGDLSVGDRVVLAIFPNWSEGAFSMKVADQLGGSLDGVLRERLCWPASAVIRIPEHLDAVQAASLPCSAVTAWHALELMDLQPGQSVLSTTTGNVSIFAVQFARANGLIPHLLSANSDRLRELDSAGITALHGVPEELADGAVHTFGDVNSTAELLRVGGRIAFVSPAGSAPVNPITLFSRNIDLRAVSLGTVEQTRKVVDAASRHGIRIPIIDTLGFEDVPRAFSIQASNAHLGKVAIAVSA